MLLQIRNFAEEDAGVYMCTSTNSLGKIEGSIRLYQIGENIRDTALLYMERVRVIRITRVSH